YQERFFMSNNGGDGGCLGLIFYAAGSILLTAGGVYWVWVAIKVEDLFMLIVGVVPAAWVVTCPVGAWAILFGWPGWVMNLFEFSWTYPGLFA
ncbi:MAG: hypothetical protein ACK2UO_01695, partial [Caldilineaceae bacterium]